MLLEVRNVRKQYRRFDLDCSLQVQEGRIVGLIGKNGAGKSTTFKAILNLVIPDSGEIRIFGTDSRELDSELRQRIGVVLADSTFSNIMTVKQIADVMGRLYAKFDAEDFFRKCDRFQIPLRQKTKEFSTGMLARLKLLIAMSYQADLLILDEPAAGLDVLAREEIMDLLREYMMEEHRSILISSHISSDLEKLCDEIYMIDQGRIILHEETDRILSDYGILKLDEAQFSGIEKQYLLRKQKEAYGVRCLTDARQFYLENYPGVLMEKGSIDDVISMMIQGERL